MRNDRSSPAKAPVQEIVHASCAGLNDKAVLIFGTAGAGKSALALQLIALGAKLVADDQTRLEVQGDALIASAPKRISGLIEARGIGLLNAPLTKRALVALAIDLDVTETERMPPNRFKTILGTQIPLLHKVESVHFPSAIYVYLKHGRNTER